MSSLGGGGPNELADLYVMLRAEGAEQLARELDALKEKAAGGEAALAAIGATAAAGGLQFRSLADQFRFATTPIEAMTVSLGAATQRANQFALALQNVAVQGQRLNALAGGGGGRALVPVGGGGGGGPLVPGGRGGLVPAGGDGANLPARPGQLVTARPVEGAPGMDVAGGLTIALSAVAAAAQVVRRAFDAVATRIEGNARVLDAFNSNLGAVNVGMQREIENLRQIPLVGDALARMREAERKEIQTRVGFVQAAAPGLVLLLERAAENLKAEMGMGHEGEVERMTEATRAVNRLRATARRQGVDVDNNALDPDAEVMARRMGLRRVIHQIQDEGKDLSPGDLAGLVQKGLEATGAKALAPETVAFRPATGFESAGNSYRRIQEGIAKFGTVDPQEKGNGFLKEIRDGIAQVVEELQKRPPAIGL